MQSNTDKSFRNAKALVGRRIRSRREFLSLSQEELGFRINADQAYISRLEHGLLNPTLESLVEISEALDVQVQNLFTL